MAVASRLDQVLEMFLDNYMRSVYSILPCEVVGVNYDTPSVDCKPLVYDVNDEGQTVKIAEINDVPLFVYSGQKGKVKITMPVAVGDRVAVLLSDADTSNVMINPNGDQPVVFIKRNDMYPLMAIPCFFTPAAPNSISSTDIVIENSSSKIQVKPDGNIFANMCNITPDGNVITKNGTNLDSFYQDYTSFKANHTHSGVEGGNGNTGVPN